MAALEVLVYCVITATVAWGITWAWAAATFSRSRAALQEELRHCQAEATRAKAAVAQLTREISAWSRGCKQGREDVIAVVPLLIAAQAQHSDLEAAAESSPDC